MKTNVSIIVWIVDTCACGGGSVIDLSPLAWKTLGAGKIPFSRGVQDVRVEILP
jgi:rare lipoprotein A (peptidoglycan hydrolase)